MHDAMQVVLAHVFAGKPWPYPLACVPWKVDGKHFTLKLKPYRDLVKAALVCKDAHAQFRQFLEAKIWEHESQFYIFDSIFCEAVGEFGFHTWKEQPQASNTFTTRWSICLHDTHFVGATISCRETAPGVHEIAAHYGVAEVVSSSTTLTTTVPAGEYVRESKRKAQHSHEVMMWHQREADALRVFLAEQHSLRV